MYYINVNAGSLISLLGPHLYQGEDSLDLCTVFSFIYDTSNSYTKKLENEVIVKLSVKLKIDSCFPHLLFYSTQNNSSYRRLQRN